MKRIYLTMLWLTGALSTQAMTFNKQQGWLESAYVEWAPVYGAASYQVTYSGEGVTDASIDKALIREYADYMRADVLGLKAGEYTITVKALDNNGDEIDQAVTNTLTVRKHIREGFAFTDGHIPGAYNMDGTPKAGAKILYVTSDNVNSLTCDVAIDKKGPKTYTGLTEILKARGKGYEDTPMIIRIIGCLKKLM